ncbi:Uncharacterised protein [Mycobacteroides abscessus subsp. abscessus]|nr:Uncharacterised protein [Mycobacteroides abscessus subsp. abscessus]
MGPPAAWIASAVRAPAGSRCSPGDFTAPTTCTATSPPDAAVAPGVPGAPAAGAASEPGSGEPSSNGEALPEAATAILGACCSPRGTNSTSASTARAATASRPSTALGDGEKRSHPTPGVGTAAGPRSSGARPSIIAVSRCREAVGPARRGDGTVRRVTR